MVSQCILCKPIGQHKNMWRCKKKKKRLLVKMLYVLEHFS